MAVPWACGRDGTFRCGTWYDRPVPEHWSESLAGQRDLRAAAIAHVRALERRHGVLSWGQIAAGFLFRGERVFLANRPRGIFAPAGLTTGALSIKTTNVVRDGREPRYDDQIAGGDPFFGYAYQGQHADARDNAALRKCLERALPVIYFYGVGEATYRPLICRVVDEDREAKRFHVAPAAEVPAEIVAEEDGAVRSFERRYSMTEVRRRLHQDKFREAVLDAYEKRCAICALRHPELLEAAHIIPDRERLGEAKVPNGLSLCKLHHAAYDAEMLGITPDRIVKLRRELLEERDGPMLEHGLRAFHGSRLWVPAAPLDQPDPELLEERWSRFAA